MKFSKWIVLMTAPLIALACAQKVDAPAAPDLPPEHVSGENDLQTVTTGQALTDSQWNQQNFLTRSRIPEFRAVYKFHSGTGSTLQVFRLLATTTCQGQGTVGARMLTLQSDWDDKPTLIQEGQSLALISDTDYELAITQPLDCDSAQMSLRFLAWIGTSNPGTPDVARICQDAQGSTLTFFPLGSRAYLDPQHPYLDEKTYCGTNSTNTLRQCMTLSFNGQEETHCYEGANEQDGFAMRMSYDSGLQQLKLQCSLKGAVFAQKDLQACHDLILDSSLYH